MKSNETLRPQHAQRKSASLAAARSYLFVPGDRPERFEKAWMSAADAVILDLEDAVSIENKDNARQAISSWATAEKPVIVRINAADTEWHACDLALVEHPGVCALMVPKAEALAPELVDACRRESKGIIPIVETAGGFNRLDELAMTECVERIAFGTLDFQVDTGIEGGDDALLYFRSHLVLKSRVAGLPAPIDGVTVNLNDRDLLLRETERTKRFGFGAKLCIHPSQVAVVNTVLSPSDEELAWAKRVLQALTDSAGAAVALDGKMVDRPVVLKAQKILAAAQR
jgi:citrate lyase subunit beta/citryl-CoA lyase